MEYKQFIKNMKADWIGKRVLYDGNEYTVIDVDYNGALLINKKAQFTDTTAVGTWMVKVKG